MDSSLGHASIISLAQADTFPTPYVTVTPGSRGTKHPDHPWCGRDTAIDGHG